MKKRIIYRVEVNEIGAKIRFQIRLPRDTKSIEEIMIHSPNATASNGTSERGSLWLSIPERRDTFYSELVRHHTLDAGIDGFAPIRHISPVTSFTHWTEGTKYKPLTAFVPGSVTLIEGFYIDHSGAGFNGAYAVHIYLTLEI